MPLMFVLVRMFGALETDSAAFVGTSFGLTWPLWVVAPRHVDGTFSNG
jgi:hypothetical protein